MMPTGRLKKSRFPIQSRHCVSALPLLLEKLGVEEAYVNGGV